MTDVHVMRLAAMACAAALLVTYAPVAEAHHRPIRYCSETGDICQSVTTIDGVRKLRIATAALYFEGFYLCVRDPSGAEVCERHTMRKRADGTYGRSVRWRDHIWFQRNPGAYTVRWLASGERIGKVLGFHRR